MKKRSACRIGVLTSGEVTIIEQRAGQKCRIRLAGLGRGRRRLVVR
jgi:hypothetical protein